MGKDRELRRVGQLRCVGVLGGRGRPHGWGWGRVQEGRVYADLREGRRLCRIRGSARALGGWWQAWEGRRLCNRPFTPP
jgi:hypothetical protein